MHRLSKHQCNPVKNTPLRVVFSTPVSAFGNPDETLSPVFGILLNVFEGVSLGNPRYSDLDASNGTEEYTLGEGFFGPLI